MTRVLQCVKADDNAVDHNCQLYDWNVNRCIICDSNFYVNPNGSCQLKACKTFDASGGCSDCYFGFVMRYLNGLGYC